MPREKKPCSRVDLSRKTFTFGGRHGTGGQNKIKHPVNSFSIYYASLFSFSKWIYNLEHSCTYLIITLYAFFFPWRAGKEQGRSLPACRQVPVLQRGRICSSHKTIIFHFISKHPRRREQRGLTGEMITSSRSEGGRVQEMRCGALSKRITRGGGERSWMTTTTRNSADNVREH